jgi:predicted protein tyrosine phosphatase
MAAKRPRFIEEDSDTEPNDVDVDVDEVTWTSLIGVYSIAQQIRLCQKYATFLRELQKAESQVCPSPQEEVEEEALVNALIKD